jgi:glycosyltransferase involved in cell wall biosynthesis
LTTAGASLLISIITPTYAREALLPFVYRCFVSQTAGDLEWIVLDDSPAPSASLSALADPRVRYEHLPQRTTAGEKRNRAVEMARGDIIVLFDDDDYYAPQYVATMVEALHKAAADFVKLSAFFVYSQIYRKFGYVDLKQKGGFHFRWSQQPMAAMNLSPDDPGLADQLLGYGFNYVFKKSLWGRYRFPHVSSNSDTPFVKEVIAHGARLALLDDDSGLCLHILHANNVSACHPQHTLPDGLVAKWFPHLSMAIRERMPGNDLNVNPIQGENGAVEQMLKPNVTPVQIRQDHGGRLEKL